MPKIIELTVEIEIQRVSCPGVWLCQDGRVSLSVFALGTSYQTCLLPPTFPLMFKDIFYFRKRFQETCALNNICCLLKSETIYCELVQWCDDCTTGECTILAQYLGALNDVLFPPNMCSNDGVDLLMRRSKEFPGILSPKIEIATKVRLDEVWNQPCQKNLFKPVACHCTPTEVEGGRQKQVCHTAKYHRNKCTSSSIQKAPSVMRSSRSRSRSGDSRSCCSLAPVQPEVNCRCPNPTITKSRTCLSRSPRRRRSTSRCTRKCPEYNVYNVQTSHDVAWTQSDNSQGYNNENDDLLKRPSSVTIKSNNGLPSERLQKILLESNYIDQDTCADFKPRERSRTAVKITPCVCEICKRYHELFHTNLSHS